MSIMSLNVNGLNNTTKLHSILRSSALPASVGFFQETKFSNPHISASAEYQWRRLTLSQGSWFACPPRYPETDTGHSCRGVVTTVHPDAPIAQIEQIHIDQEALANRYVLVRGTYKGKPLYLHNIYAPSDHRDRGTFFAALPTQFEDDAEHIAGGDFNVILSESLDSFNPQPSNLAGVEQLTTWLQALDLVDVFRQDNPSTVSFTSPKHNNRLDYIFCSRDMYSSANTTSAHVHNDTQSDHSACTFVLAPQTRPQPGPWRTPMWLTKLPEARDIVNGNLDFFLKTVKLGPLVGPSYDSMIYSMREQLRLLHRNKVAVDVAPQRALERELAIALEDLRRHPCQVIIDSILDIKQRLKVHHEEVREYKAEAAVQRHLSDAARCTKHHLKSPSIKPLIRATIQRMRGPDGTVHDSGPAIKTVLRDYYAELYASTLATEPGMVEQYLEESVTTKLPQAMATRLAAPVLASEFYEAIMKSARTKAPGPNALPYEVLRLAPEKWAQTLELVFNYVLYTEPTLTRSQVQGTTVLLHKKGDRDQPANYRPISLVNCDVKILTAVLANRLQPCADLLVHHDQTGFIRGRSITHNIQRLEDLLEFSRRHKPQAVVALLDFEKAFDRVDHSFLLSTLRKMGLPSRFCCMVQCLYSGRRSKLLVNGGLSEPFHINRGVLQGDPLSPLLFVLALEPMCNSLRKHSSLGLQIGSSLHVVSCFADDSQLFAANEIALTQQLQLVDNFCQLSGFKLNRAKTEILTHGPLIGVVESRVVLATAPTKSLGILVAPGLSSSVRREHALHRFRDRLVLWQHKTTSLVGKAIILQAVCLPVLWYQLAWVAPDAATAKKIDNMMLQFVHGEAPTIGPGCRGYRPFHQDIVFTPKAKAGLGLKRTLGTWERRHRGHALRYMQAALTSTAAPAWTSAGMELVGAVYSPWGNFADLAYCNPRAPIVQRTIGSPAVTAWWQALLQHWFAFRVQPSPLPAPSPLLDNQPLWHNGFLPVDSLYIARSSRWYTRYSRTMAIIGFTRVRHLHTIMAETPDTNSTRQDKVNQLVAVVQAKCRQYQINIHSRPSVEWLAWLAGIAMTFECRQLPPVMPAPWLIKINNKIQPLATTTTAQARRNPTVMVDPPPLKTSHLGATVDFYDNLDNVAAAASLRQPDGILPKLADFVYKVVLRAIPLRGSLPFLHPGERRCSFCPKDETYRHFFVDCVYVKDVWATIGAVLEPLGVLLPSTLKGFLFDTLKTTYLLYQGAFNQIWPIIRACVWFHIWRVRNDRTFRPDLPTPSPWSTALRAARLIQLHLHHSVLQDPDQPDLLRLLRLLQRYEWPRDHVVPASVSHVPIS